jgi:NDP-sugar pyrophosphorylase family protein
MIRFFFLAGGYGKRAQPLTFIKPKPLFPLNGKPLIELILIQLENKGINSGFINLHYKPNEIKENLKNTRNITFFYEEKLSGSQILSRASQFLGDDYLLVINGDIFLDIPVDRMKKKVIDSGADGVILVREDSTFNYSVLNIRRDRYKSVNSDLRTGLMYTGIALFKKSVVEKIEDLNFFQTLAKNQFDIRILPYDKIWLDLGDPRSYLKAHIEYEKYLIEKGELKSDFKLDNVFISVDSKVERSILWENTMIKSKSVVTNSIITGNIVLENVNYDHKIVMSDGIVDL